MPIKDAQKIVNRVHDRMSMSLVTYQRDELAWLKDQLENFLDTEVETEELSDPDDADAEFNDMEDEEDSFER